MYKLCFAITVICLISIFSGGSLLAQSYVSPTKSAVTGRSPGLKVKLIASDSQSKTYVLIFETGDEVVSGLTEFAQKYEVKAAHYTGIGDATTARMGWFDNSRKQFKEIVFNDPVEVSSLTGDIALFDGKPVAHTHVNISKEDGTSHGGHLLEMIIGPTLEVFVTVLPATLSKRLKPEFDAAVINLD